jgi:hypothetical protein
MRLRKESNITWNLERLGTNDAWKIANALYLAADLGRKPQPEPAPTGNTEIITYLEQLVEDNRLCPVDWRIPYAFGELRWLAARILACEYIYQGIKTSIVLQDAIQPIRNIEIAMIIWTVQ